MKMGKCHAASGQIAICYLCWHVKVYWNYCKSLFVVFEFCLFFKSKEIKRLCYSAEAAPISQKYTCDSFSEKENCRLFLSTHETHFVIKSTFARKLLKTPWKISMNILLFTVIWILLALPLPVPIWVFIKSTKTKILRFYSVHCTLLNAQLIMICHSGLRAVSVQCKLLPHCHLCGFCVVVVVVVAGFSAFYNLVWIWPNGKWTLSSNELSMPTQTWI